MGNQCQRTIRTDGERYAGEAPTCAVPDGLARTCGPVGNLFLEPQGQTTSETWHYVGEGRGTYAKMQSYGFVGQGQGTYDKELTQTDYAGNGRKLCLFSIAALLMGGLGYAIVAPSLRPAIGRFTQSLSAPSVGGFGSHHQGGELVTLTTPPPVVEAPSSSEFLAYPTAAPAAAIPWQPEVSTAAPVTAAPSSTSTSTTRPPQHFICAVGPEAIKAAKSVEALWLRADADGSAGLSREELQGASAVLSTRTKALLLDGDVDGDGRLSHDEFAAALRLADEADRNGTTAVGMDAAMAQWPKDQRAYCCDHAGTGCMKTPAPVAPAAPVGVAGGQPLPAPTAAAAAAAPLSSPALPSAAPPAAAAGAEGASPPPPQEAGAPAASASEASTVAPTAAAVAGMPADPYDCTTTSSEKSWSLGQKDWCCRHKSRGCEE